MANKFAVGDLIQIVKKPQGSDNTFDVGEVVRIKGVPDDDDDFERYYRCEYLDGRDWWYVRENEMEAHVEESSEGQVEVVVDLAQRKEAYEWAELHIPEADTAEIVLLANWLLTGTYR